MANANLEDPEVSLARYHDRYMATLKGQYAAGYEDGKAENSQALQKAEADRVAALARIKELEEVLAKYREEQAEQTS